MADDLVITASAADYTHRLAFDLISQDVEANESTYSFEYSVYFGGTLAAGAVNTTNVITFTVVADGDTHTATPNFDFTTSRDLVVMTGEVTVGHATNGTATLTASLASSDTFPTPALFPGVSQSGSLAVPLIDRATIPVITPSPVFMGDTADFIIEPADPGFLHDITYTSGSASGSIASNTPGSGTWTPPSSLLAVEDSVYISVKTVTKLSGVPVGSPKYVDFEFRKPQTFPTILPGAAFDIRFRRVIAEGGKLVPKEAITYLSASVTDTFSASGACSLEVSNAVYPESLDETVVVVDMFDGADWAYPNLVFVLSRVEGDITDPSGTVKYTGQSYVDYLLAHGLVWTGGYEADDATPGLIMSNFMGYAFDRAWAPHLRLTFNADRTSLNTPWQYRSKLEGTQDIPISQVLEGLVSDVVVEYRTRLAEVEGWAVLSMYNPGYGTDWTTGSTIVNLGFALNGRTLRTAPVRKDYSSKLTRVVVRGDEAAAVRQNGSYVNPAIGHLEGAVNATGIKDSNRLNQLGDALLKSNRYASVERTFEYDLSSTETPTEAYPYRTIRPGDWVFIPTETGRTKARIAQINLTRDSEGTRATLTTGDLIPNGVAATARKLAQSTGSGVSAGNMKSPEGVASAIPAAPTPITISQTAYWDPSGSPKGMLAIDWPNITKSMQGSAISVDLYEAWIQFTAGGPWALAGTSNTSNVDVSGLDIASSGKIRVRGRSVGGVYGDWSNPKDFTIPSSPAATLAAPSAPVLSADGLGTITVSWNGLIAGSTPPKWMNYVQAEISDTSGGAYSVAGQQLQGAGDMTIPAVGAGTWWIRLVGYDNLNNRGATSTPVSVVVDPVLGDTRQPKAPTGLTIDSTGYWDGYIARSKSTMSWSAVTEGVDNEPISIRVYEVWAKGTGDTTFRWMGATESTTITVDPIPFPLGTDWVWTVTATAVNNERSDMSAEGTGTTIAPASTVDKPTQPSASSVQGLLLVEWDGRLFYVGYPGDESDDVIYDAPDFISSVDIEVSVDEGVTWQNVGFMTRGDRTQSVSGIPVGSTARVRLVAYTSLGTSSEPSEETETVIIGIDGDDILADTITANHIQAGSIGVNHLEPSFGNDLDISANGTVTILSGQAANAQSTADTAANDVQNMRTRYDFTPTEAVISQPGSAFQVAISNTQLEFRESGVARAYLNAGVFNAPQLASREIVLGYHVIVDDPSGDGTVIRRR